MDKTPIQTIISLLEESLSHIEDKTLFTHQVTQRIIDCCKKHLPYEKQFAEEMFNAGYKRGEDQQNVIDQKLGQYFPDFKTIYLKYEK